MFGAFAGIYGKAGADELMEKLVGKLTKNTTGQVLLTWIINAAGEGVEEVTSDLLNPLADRLLKLDNGTGPIWSIDDLAQWGYDFLLGTAMGILGGGTQLARGVRQGQAQTAEDAYYSDLRRNGLGSAAAAENAQRASDAMGRIMPARDGLRMPRLVDEQGRTYEERQAAYRGAVPQNVDNPRIGRLEMSSAQYNPSGADIRTVYGNRYRKQVKENAIRRLGIADGRPAYLSAPNITKDGREYYVDVTKASLNKMLFTKEHESLELERILLVDNLEKAIDGSYWAESNGDRKGRLQIDGFDTLRTSFYIDGIPYYADIKVKVVDKGAGQNSQNVAYHIEPEEITSIKKMDTSSPTGGRHAPNIFFRDGVSISNISVPQGGTGVNTQGMQNGREYDLLANVRKKPDGEYVYSIQLNENKKKAPAPLLGRAYTSKETLDGYPQNRVLTNTYGNSIPTFGGNVNGEKYSTGRRLDEQGRTYDERILAQESIEKEEPSSSATANTEQSPPHGHPSISSFIRVQDLLRLVNSGYQKYVPKMANAEMNTVGAFTNNSQSLGGSAPAISSAFFISIPTFGGNDDAAQELSRGVADTRSLADTTSAASGTSIPTSGGNV